jgi:hypothetical protein
MLLGLLGAGVLGTATGGLWVLRSARLQALSPLASLSFSRDEKVDHFFDNVSYLIPTNEYYLSCFARCVLLLDHRT